MIARAVRHIRVHFVDKMLSFCNIATGFWLEKVGKTRVCDDQIRQARFLH